MNELMQALQKNGLFFILFFSGILFGVVAQRIVDNKPVKPLTKRLTIAGITMSLALTFNRMSVHFDEATLYTISPIIGFFGEVTVEMMNAKRTGIGKGILELFLERLGIVKKGGKDEEDVSQK